MMRATVCVFLAVLCVLGGPARAGTAVEDFESDAQPGQAGFAAAVFRHFVGPNEYTGTGGLWNFWDGDYVSPTHCLMLGVATDYVTFDLPVGTPVTYASVWYRGWGAASVFHVIGTNGEFTAFSAPAGPFEFIDTSSAQVGEIVEIRLSGYEGGFDDLTITFNARCEPCDANCDGSVNQFDIQPFINLLSGAAPCSACAGDTTADGTVNQFDIQGFIDCLQ